MNNNLNNNPNDYHCDINSYNVAVDNARSITEALGKIAPIVEKAESKKAMEAKAVSSSFDVVVKDEPKSQEIEKKLDNLQNLIEEKIVKSTDTDKPKTLDEATKEEKQLQYKYNKNF